MKKSKKYKVLAKLDFDDDILVHRYEKCDPLLSQEGAEGYETCSFTMAANKFLVQEDIVVVKGLKTMSIMLKKLPNQMSHLPTPRPYTSAQALYSLDLTHAQHFIVRFSQFFGIIQ
jgi:hypothetical protein